MLAFVLLFQTVALTRSASESMILGADKTTYYEYYESDMNSVDENGNRIVTLEDIIPTIYRYFTESSAVTIIDKDGDIVTRFDRQTETLCNNWNDRTVSQKELVLNEINYVLRPCRSKYYR